MERCRDRTKDQNQEVPVVFPDLDLGWMWIHLQRVLHQIVVGRSIYCSTMALCSLIRLMSKKSEAVPNHGALPLAPTNSRSSSSEMAVQNVISCA